VWAGVAVIYIDGKLHGGRTVEGLAAVRVQFKRIRTSTELIRAVPRKRKHVTATAEQVARELCSSLID
jgi:hypothetical protein